MKKLPLALLCSVGFLFANATNRVVNSISQLNAANQNALPGDSIFLKNGEWQNVSIALTCKGSVGRPIVFQAETAGRVFITGKSNLSISGEYIEVGGLYFRNGYSGKNPVLSFASNSNQRANHCRVTGFVIDDFNNPKRLDENYWVSLYGKNNRIDHCSFINKKNMGVLLAVILDDDRSRENSHSIDHNYFGQRLPLASNTGEIIRVGVSEHCEFKSSTSISDNYFENCDGEAEVISIKSCNNLIRNNLFKTCQGAVVLRHGNYNVVENNLFLGNGKPGTGGVRIINKGQWVVNNYFYQCRGEGFRSPLSIMNGVPNSPAFRYVAVTDALVANNSFFDCSPISFCLGSDQERSVSPDHVEFLNNVFDNSRDSLVFNNYDNIKSIHFKGNLVNRKMPRKLVAGFENHDFMVDKNSRMTIPVPNNLSQQGVGDSLQQIAIQKLAQPIGEKPGVYGVAKFIQIRQNAAADCGAVWHKGGVSAPVSSSKVVDCKNSEELLLQLDGVGNAMVNINLTGREYVFSSAVNIGKNVRMSSRRKETIRFVSSAAGAPFLIQIKAGYRLDLSSLKLDLSELKTAAFMATDTSGSSNHSNLSVINCDFSGFEGSFVQASKTSLLDSAIIIRSNFRNFKGAVFSGLAETDLKGYYNVEHLTIANCGFSGGEGQILGLLRSGKDESTMGPFVIFSNNNLLDCNALHDEPLISFNGIQKTVVEANSFTNCNAGRVLLQFVDIVNASHLVRNNRATQSGAVVANQYVGQQGNVFQ